MTALAFDALLSACALRPLRGLRESRGTLPVMLEQLVTDLVEMRGQDPKPDIPLKPRPAFVGAPIHPMVFQRIDV